MEWKVISTLEEEEDQGKGKGVAGLHGGDSLESSCQLLECHFAWDDFLV